MIRIDVLPDDVLLEIFDFYMDIDPSLGFKRGIEVWQLLVHVCRRWRSLVFGSPRRLNLRLLCAPETPARDALDVWPSLPLLINGDMTLRLGPDNIVAALGQSNRVCQVNLSGLADRQLETILAAMQVPFPELTELALSSYDVEQPVIPDSFLGGSSPRLRTFDLEGIPFPGLPKLLSSATHLAHLNLSNIPHSGYISPEAMADLLSVLSSLQILVLEFQSPQSRPNWEGRRPPPSKCSVVPALINFYFKGVIEYLENLVTYIDAPQLDHSHLFLTFINQIDFDSPRLAQFISRTPILADCDAHVEFYDGAVGVRLSSHLRDIEIQFSCGEPDQQLSSVAQVCNTCLPPLSMIEGLYIEHHYLQLVWRNEAIENTQWLELLLPFTAVKDLYLSKGFAPGIAASLQEIVRTDVLPSLQNIFVEGLEPSGPFQESIGQFVSARQHSGHPIVISVWERDFELIDDIDSDVDSDSDLDVDLDADSDVDL